MKKKLVTALCMLSVAAMLFGCGQAETAVTSEPVSEETLAEGPESSGETDAEESKEDASEEKGDSQIASSDEMAEPVDILEEGMTPITADMVAEGEYEISVLSSSKMFNITACTLTVADGEMQAVMTMGGTGYEHIYMGTGQEAVDADVADYVKPVENENGEHTFTVKVEALDAALDCAAFSKKKQKWYERQLVFKASSLPADALLVSDFTSWEDAGLTEGGKYYVEVAMEGGSGKAHIDSPCLVEVKDGVAYATIVWSSSHYDYMIVDGEKYEPIPNKETSTFVIPIAGFDSKMTVIADTTAMGTPHEIEYKFTFDSNNIAIEDNLSSSIRWDSLHKEESTPLSYATQFQIDRYTYGYKVITIAKGGHFLIVPKYYPIPSGAPSDMTAITLPVKNGYIVSSSSMDLICEVGGLESFVLSGTKQEDWARGDVAKAMEKGKLHYAGKYSEPDYELILQKGCDLAVYNTMLSHKPEVKEKMEGFGIPVLIERSSYEEHPLGRLEWMKVYGALFGKEMTAKAEFEKECEKAQEAMSQKKTGKSVAFFYVTGNGTVNVRKASDYVAKMIDLAGGTYAFSDLKPEDDSKTSTVNVSLEEFYAKAKNCDILIYNSTIVGEIETKDQLLEICPVLSGCQAFQTDNLYCTNQDFFQRMTKMPDFMVELGQILRGEKCAQKVLFQVK